MLTCYFEKAFKVVLEDCLLYDKCLFCIKGHETSALLILEKITDRNLINATNAALQTYVSAVTVLYIWCVSAKTSILLIKRNIFQLFFSKWVEFSLNFLTGIKSLTDL